MSLLIYGALTLMAAVIFTVMRYGDSSPKKPSPKTPKSRRRAAAPRTGSARYRPF